MTRGRWNMLLPLAGLAVAGAAFMTACPGGQVTVTVTGPTQAPPVVRSPPVDCPSNQYYRVGRYHWRKGRYVFARGRCTPRPAAWHRGCRWVRGKWVKRGRTYRWTAGRNDCPRRTVLVHPRSLPPPPRSHARKCGPTHYARPGHWKWVRGQWRWQPGACVSRPAHWSTRGCRYQRGSWRKVGNKVVRTRGRVVCGPVARRCTPAMRRAGRCGSVPPTLRTCKKGYYRFRGKCVRQGVRRCTKAMQKAGRCGRPIRIKPCKKNYYRHRGKCVRRGVRRCTRAMRKAGRCR